MPSQKSTATIGPDGICSECRQPHVPKYGGRPCQGHVRFERDPASPNYRARLPQPRPCQKPAKPGLTRCHMHGVSSKKARAAGERRVAEEKAIAVARKLIPDLDDRAPIRNPLERLLELAAEADAFRESLRQLANKLDDDIRYRGAGAGAEQLRAEVSTYRVALKDTTDLLVAIARLDIEKTLARVTLAQAEQALAAFRAGMDDAQLSDEQKRTVMTSAGRHLRAVAG